jgi:hypothetical protein
MDVICFVSFMEVGIVSKIWIDLFFCQVALDAHNLSMKNWYDIKCS